MTNLILDKKLQECESNLIEILETPNHELYSDDQVQNIQKSLDFLKNLLSAEVTSSPLKSQQLQQIANRISDLETAFHNWNEFRITTTTQDRIERSLTCSCTESCMNDDCEDSPPRVQENAAETLVEDEKAPPGKEGTKVEEWSDDLKKAEKGVGRIIGSMAAGMLIGMALMGLVMVRLCGCFPCEETTPMCITPT